MELSRQVDFFMLNEFEAKSLTQTSSLPLALDQLQARRLIVTMGRLGAIMNGIDSEPQMVPALSVPTGRVLDTTGAGDTWNGAFLASYQATGDLTRSVTAASVISSIKCSHWGFEAIRNLAFRNPTEVIEHVLALKEGWRQRRITDFSRPR